MNLTGRPPYQKGTKRKSRGKAKRPTAAQIRYRERVRVLGCVVGYLFGKRHCYGYTQAHHAGTGAGGRKDHWKLLPLCTGHHIGPEGIDGKRMSKKAWQEKYGTEEALLKEVERQLKLMEENDA